MRLELDGSVALVTGASSGIGESLARQLAGRVRAIALVARREQRLEDLAKELREAQPELFVTVHVCDLTDRQAVDAMLDEVERQHGVVDVLINNAGFGDMGMFDLAAWDKTERMIALNITALTYLTHRLAGPMVEQRRGGILMVSSGFGLTFMPGFSVYVGSKHFVTGFTESLRIDLAPMGVVVSQVCPGPVATEFEQGVDNFTGSRPQRFIEISAERCARASLRGLERGRALIVPGLAFRFIVLFAALTPRWLLRLAYGRAARWLRHKQDASRRALAEPAES